MRVSADDIHDGNLMNGIPKADKDTIVADAKKLNLLLTAGFLLAISILLVKILKLPPIIVFLSSTLSVPIAYSWLIFLLLSIAHGYFAFCLISSIDSFRSNPNVTECKNAFSDLRDKVGIFFKGLIPRGTSNVKNMDLHDQSTWIQIIGILLLLSAIIPFEIQKIWRFVFYIVVAFEIAFVNWYIGSCWVRAVSRLKDPEGKKTECLMNIFAVVTMPKPKDLLIIIGIISGTIIIIYLNFILLKS